MEIKCTPKELAEFVKEIVQEDSRDEKEFLKLVDLSDICSSTKENDDNDKDAQSHPQKSIDAYIKEAEHYKNAKLATFDKDEREERK